MGQGVSLKPEFIRSVKLDRSTVDMYLKELEKARYTWRRVWRTGNRLTVDLALAIIWYIRFTKNTKVIPIPIVTLNFEKDSSFDDAISDLLEASK